jgi:hypothetical protein
MRVRLYRTFYLLRSSDMLLVNNGKSLKGFKWVCSITNTVIFMRENEVECTEWQRKLKIVIDSKDILAVVRN